MATRSRQGKSSSVSRNRGTGNVVLENVVQRL